MISANGMLQQQGGEMQAAGHVCASGASLQQSSRGDTASLIVAGGALRVEVEQDIVNEGGTLRGTQRANDDPDLAAAVTLQGGRQDRAQHFARRERRHRVRQRRRRRAQRTSWHRGSERADHQQRRPERYDRRHPAQRRSVRVPGAGSINWSSGSGLTAQSGRSLDMGTLADPDHQAYLVAGGALTIKAGDVQNIGGHIYSNNSAVAMDGCNAR